MNKHTGYSKGVLQAMLATAVAGVEELKLALQEAEAQPSYYQYHDLVTAEGELYDILLARASADCEGSYNVGQPEYTQECFIDDELHLATMKVEYNRHDKTYYYVDETTLTINPILSTKETT